MSEPISNAEPGACHKGGDLRVHGHLRSRLSPGEGGPARKVYTLTGSGERCLAGWYTTVRTRRAALDRFLTAYEHAGLEMPGPGTNEDPAEVDL